MQIIASKKFEPQAVSVIVVKGGKKIIGHPFYKNLSDEDKLLLNRFLEKTPVAEPGSHIVFLPSGIQVVLFGIGDPAKFTARKAVLAIRRLTATAKREKIKILLVDLADFAAKGASDLEYLAETLALQSEVANFEYTHYKTPPKEGWNRVEKIVVFGGEKRVQKALARGQVIGEEINRTRELANTPGGDMAPQTLAEAAVSTGKRCGIKVSVMDEKKIRELGMGGLTAVGKGSINPPRFIMMEYMKGSKKEKPVVLVGKGITFDSGGLNLKPSQNIYEMHLDMSGGAAVIHILAALARLKAKKNVVGLIAAAENMPSGSSYRPGDVVKTLNGKTIEIMDTDAEGRVVLADALEYAKKYDPRLVVDIATLTGAAEVALGKKASALFATDLNLEKLFREAGERAFDFVWPLPLWEEYEDEVKATFGDWANVGKSRREAGAIIAAVFLWQFIKPFPWVHLDIAPRMTPSDSEFLAKGAAGTPVNLLVHLLEKY